MDETQENNELQNRELQGQELQNQGMHSISLQEQNIGSLAQNCINHVQNPQNHVQTSQNQVPIAQNHLSQNHVSQNHFDPNQNMCYPDQIMHTRNEFMEHQFDTSYDPDFRFPENPQ